MKSFLVLSVITAAVFAAPKPGKLDDVPTGSYLPGIGSSISSIGSSGPLISGISSSIESSSILSGDLSAGLAGGFHGGLSAGGIESFGGSILGGGGYSGGGGGYSGGGNLHHDQRHVYFYSAPDDEKAAHLRVYVEPSSQRHTKVIFVKAPSFGGVIPEVIAPPSQAIDRTKIYVLQRKQEHGGSITVPSSLGVKQAQPEVFFIKYKNEHDAEAAVNQGLHGAHIGVPVSNLGNENVFIRTLSSGHGGGIGGIGIGGGSIGGGANILGSGIKFGPAGQSGPYK